MAADGWALRVEGLGKEYLLGEHTGRPGGTLAETLGELWAGLWRRPAPRRRPERFWALRDISFELATGTVLGVVGRNGAGKTTLLKVLSRITAPTAGRALVRGTLASLLEVGTGFHPELTGRENIFLNGTILGMRRREIARKLDEIVALAEIEPFLDTPVKRYSSGMYVRLAFAVAAHLEADILIVDEVLSVGDAAFQRKSIGKMEEVAGSGRTVVYVSHNLGSVRTLCDSVLVLEGGRLVFRGGTEEGLDLYEATWSVPAGALDEALFRGPLGRELTLATIEVVQEGLATGVIDPTAPFEVRLAGRAERAFRELEIGVGFFRDGSRIFSCHDAPAGTPLAAGPFRSRFTIPADTLRPGRWTLGAGARRPGGEWKWGENLAVLEVSERWREGSQARDQGWVTVPVVGERRQ